jgi:prolipoprotein diacylglyceryltransferase
LLVFGVLLWAEKRFRFRNGQTFALYVALYTFGRIWFEALRVDEATRIFGIRFNLLLSIALCIGSTIWFVWLARHKSPAQTVAQSVPEPTPGNTP